MNNNTYVLGMDVGGTNIRTGLVNKSFQVTDFTIESVARIGSTNAVDDLCNFIDAYINHFGKDKEIQAISIGFPATIDKARKKLLSTPNISGLDNVEIVDEIEKRLKIKTYINRDVNLLMLHDMHEQSIPDEGVATGYYLGTGLGNAIIIDGTMYTGKNGSAAELGHIPSRDHEDHCGCGNKTCVETFASGKYLTKLTEIHFPQTPIGEVFKKHKDHPVIQKYIRDLAVPIASEINILDPDYIVLGGGVLQMEDFPFEQLEDAIHEFARKPYPDENLEFIYSKPSQENGVIGAAIYAFKAKP